MSSYVECVVAAPVALLPVLVIWDGGQGRAEAVDVERHVALVTQQLHVSILLPTTHAAGAETTFCVRVGLAVLTLRSALPWTQEQHGRTTTEETFTSTHNQTL